VNSEAASCLLPCPTTSIEPEEDQSRPGGHEADAQSLTSLPHSVQGESEPHHEEAGQGKDVHAEENVLDEHCPFPGRSQLGPASGARTLPRLQSHATVPDRLDRKSGGGVAREQPPKSLDIYS